MGIQNPVHRKRVIHEDRERSSVPAGAHTQQHPHQWEWQEGHVPLLRMWKKKGIASFGKDGKI